MTVHRPWITKLASDVPGEEHVVQEIAEVHADLAM
jgi:hypothetical protein